MFIINHYIINQQKYVVAIIALVLINNLTFSQGLKFTPEETMDSFSIVDNSTHGFAENIPYKYSLERFVPQPLDQDGMSCVGYASLYYTMSTMYNISFGITNPRAKLAHAFDPYFIYTIIQNDVSHCDEGLYMYQAIELIGKIGAKKMFFPPYLSCDSEWSENVLTSTLSYTKPYRIKEFYSIEINSPRVIKTIKGLVNANIPVVCAFSITKSLYPRSSSNPRGVSSSGLWSPLELEGNEGGHAMTIIGYDDYKFGGAYRIVNSWGSSYGDNGYIWMRYSDFKKYAIEAYVLELNDNIKTNARTANVQMQDSDYSRFKYKTSSYYEGQERYDKAYGYGIYTTDYNEMFFIGKTINSQLNGFTIIIDNDGVYTANARNGEFLDWNELGFAGADESLESDYQFKKYFSVIDSNTSIRKASSTKLDKKSFEVPN